MTQAETPQTVPALMLHIDGDKLWIGRDYEHATVIFDRPPLGGESYIRIIHRDRADPEQRRCTAFLDRAALSAWFADDELAEKWQASEGKLHERIAVLEADGERDLHGRPPEDDPEGTHCNECGGELPCYVVRTAELLAPVAPISVESDR